MRYAVTYEELTITESKAAFDLNKCCSVMVENQGDEALTINAGIALAVGNSIDFKNEPNEFINQTFKFVFAGGGTNPRALIIKKFVNPINK